MIKEVKFQGLAHSPSEYDSTDGELGACLNLIPEDGALKPISAPSVAELFKLPNDSCSIKFVHKVTHGNDIHSHYIVNCTSGSPYKWYWTEKGGDGAQHEIDLGDFEVNSVAAVGNIICFVGDFDIKYSFWNQIKNEYFNFSKSDLKYDIQVSIKDIDSFGTSLSVDLGEDFWNIFSWGAFGSDSESNYIVKGVQADKVIKLFSAMDSQMNSRVNALGKGFQKYNTFAVVALRLYDGSFCNISNIFRLNSQYKTFGTINVNADKKTVFSSSSLYQCSSYCINISMNNLEKIKDFIQGADVFVTKGEPFINTDEPIDKITFTDGTTKRQGNFSFNYATPSYAKDIIDKMVFYHSVYISKDDFGKDKDINRVLETETSIELADLYNESIGGKCAFAFNNRLHIANCYVNKVKLKSTYTGSETIPSYDVLIECHTLKGTYWWKGKLSREDKSFACLNVQNTTSVIFYRHADSSSKYEIAEVKMFSSETKAYSFYIGESDKYGIDFELPWKECDKSVFDDANEQYEKYKDVNVHTQSLVKVSEAENPLVFPANNSVQVGSSIIRALASNTRPISEGQFGDAPLYAFTDEGVWTLTPTTEGTYDARQPANRDIVSNPSGILQIDDAVLFPTERGVMLQEGRTSRCITDSLDGYPIDFTTMYKESFADKVLAVNGTDKESVKYAYFRKFMEKADMIYDYYDNRIILFNPDYKYAYVYSIKSGMWGAMYNYFSKRINIYPESYAVDEDNNIVDVYDKSPSKDVPYFLCSRPLTLDLKNVHKTMFSCIARGYFGAEKGKCGVVLYGSNDLQHWQYIKSSVNKYLRGMAGSPYKYFKVAMIGSLSPSESITGMSADIQERWSNKLR